MKRYKTADLMRQGKIVAVLRGMDEEVGLDVINSFYLAGIKIFEITVEKEEGIKFLETALYYFNREISQEDMVIGVGTVLDPSQAILSIQKGAQFLVSPCFSETIIEIAHHSNTVMIPGAFTPNEFYRCLKKGVDFIKIFPINAVGKGYIKSLSGPFGDVSVFATGGVNLSNAAEYLAGGAALVGIGSGLLPSSENVTIDKHYLFELKDKIAPDIKKIVSSNISIKVNP